MQCSVNWHSAPNGFTEFKLKPHSWAFQCARTCSATSVWKKIRPREEQRSIVRWPAPPSSAITQWRTAQTIVKSSRPWLRMGSSPVSSATVPPTAPVRILSVSKEEVSMRGQESARGAATLSCATRGTQLCPLLLAPRPRPLEVSLVPQVSFWPL